MIKQCEILKFSFAKNQIKIKSLINLRITHDESSDELHLIEDIHIIPPFHSLMLKIKCINKFVNMNTYQTL